MPVLRKPLYQRSEADADDRWRLVLDTDADRLFVEHEQTRGDMRSAGYATNTDEIEVAAFLSERGEGQQQLVRLLRALFESPAEAPRP